MKSEQARRFIAVGDGCLVVEAPTDLEARTQVRRLVEQGPFALKALAVKARLRAKMEGRP